MKPISKSQFNLSRQCEKAFYLYRFNKDLLTYSAAQQQRFSQGTSFGEYMQQRFPGGVDVSKVATSFPKRIALTKAFLAKAEAPIYEATLTTEIDGIPLLCMIDILVPNNGKWDIYEVK